MYRHCNGSGAATCSVRVRGEATTSDGRSAAVAAHSAAHCASPAGVRRASCGRLGCHGTRHIRRARLVRVRTLHYTTLHYSSGGPVASCPLPLVRTAQHAGRTLVRAARTFSTEALHECTCQHRRSQVYLELGDIVKALRVPHQMNKLLVGTEDDRSGPDSSDGSCCRT